MNIDDYSCWGEVMASYVQSAGATATGASGDTSIPVKCYFYLTGAKSPTHVTYGPDCVSQMFSWLAEEGYENTNVLANMNGCCITDDWVWTKQRLRDAEDVKNGAEMRMESDYLWGLRE